MEISKKGKQLSILGNFGWAIPTVGDGSDLIANVAHRIENLNPKQARELMQHCAEARGFNAFVLGGVLSSIQLHKWHLEYGFSSFKDMLINGLGISTSAAYDYIKIYEALIEAEVPWSQVESIGWTKLRWIARYLNKNNIEQWVAVAATKNTYELHQFAKTQAKEAAEKALAPKFTANCSMEEVSTQVDTTAANDDVYGGEGEEVYKEPIVTEKAALETPQTKIFKFFPEQLEVVELAIEMVTKESGAIAQNEALTRVCMHFLTTYHPDVEHV